MRALHPLLTMMDIEKAIVSRVSVRRYKPDPVPVEHIRKMVSLATQAPSASNMQMWQFLAITNKDLLGKMRDTVEQKIDAMSQWPEAVGQVRRILGSKAWNLFFADAPLVFAVLHEPYRTGTDELLLKRGLTEYQVDSLRARPDLQSVGAAIENLLLAAHAMEYGAVWMTGPLVAARELEQVLGVTSPWRLAAIVPVGIPAEHPSPKLRKSLEEVLTIRD